MLRVLKGEKPERATLFELFLNNDLYCHLAGHKAAEESPLGHLRLIIEAMAAAGYDNLCYMLYEEPELVREIFDHVGSRLVAYYENAVGADTVGFFMFQ